MRQQNQFSIALKHLKDVKAIMSCSSVILSEIYANTTLLWCNQRITEEKRIVEFLNY